MRTENHSKKTVALAEFMRWPLSKRQRFIEREMPDTPTFIKAPLLRPTLH
ncbi:hypothetical protein LWH94_09685 [Marinobacter sp. G11]|nr:hypothetical protein [Marinobacter sp. G11]MCE0759474.1 hypothetical protein [Marinobacter sp. G11]